MIPRIREVINLSLSINNWYYKIELLLPLSSLTFFNRFFSPKRCWRTPIHELRG
ncbi:unnamed protein product, partial [Vitis vinifera]|uniref:Uncharacterized protein n=1 Tax=Vitis vinifera TaxID=29760 RepID=D7UC52_VITVI